MFIYTQNKKSSSPQDTDSTKNGSSDESRVPERPGFAKSTALAGVHYHFPDRPDESATERFRRGFRLIQEGLRLLASAPKCLPGDGIPPPEHIHGPIGGLELRPRWDRRSGTLWLGDRASACFGRAAPNQWRILDAFEEEGWPERIDDPLPGAGPGTDRRQRLGDAVKHLNRRCELIRFYRDGTKFGVGWRIAGIP